MQDIPATEWVQQAPQTVEFMLTQYSFSMPFLQLEHKIHAYMF